MTDMPERIFAWYFLECLQNESMLGGWDIITDHKEQEYIRNDLYNDMVAENIKFRDALETLSNIHDGNPSAPRADMPPLDYARHMLWEARCIARSALTGNTL